MGALLCSKGDSLEVMLPTSQPSHTCGRPRPLRPRWALFSSCLLFSLVGESPAFTPVSPNRLSVSGQIMPHTSSEPQLDNQSTKQTAGV